VRKRFISAVKKVEFVSDRMSCIIPRGCCCDVIVLYIHAPTEENIDDVKDNFSKEMAHVFSKFCK
jgi:hypothetical protein